MSGFEKDPLSMLLDRVTTEERLYLRTGTLQLPPQHLYFKLHTINFLLTYIHIYLPSFNQPSAELLPFFLPLL